jgi:preprotein translocase subunit YajC
MWLLALFAADPPAQPDFLQVLLGSPLFPLLIVFVLFIFMVQRPAMRAQEEQRRRLLASLKKNDEIVNSGGIVGVIRSIKDDDEEVGLEGGLRILKSSIVRNLTAEKQKGKEQPKASE